ncbi:DUF4129 domain-containing protein [Luteitalea sp.]
MPRDALAVVLRPRNDWEAADLGIELTRTWVRPLARAWALAYLAPALVLVAVTPRPVATALVVWWLRPWAERVLLAILARLTFSREVGLREALATVFNQGVRTPGPWLASLTWRRLSPVRTIWLAVWHLEGLRGRGARDRVRVLTREGLGAAASCTVVGVVATVLLAVAIVVTVLSLLPDATGAALAEWGADGAPLPLREARTWALVAVLADGLVAPWVTGAVFGLYISRRTDLEAWDIEVVLRDLARRVATTGLVVLALVVGAAAREARAHQEPVPSGMVETTTDPGDAIDEAVDVADEEAPEDESVPFDPQAKVRHILKQTEFGRTETIQQWQLRPMDPIEPREPAPWFLWLVERIPALARALRLVMWGVGAVAVLWLARVVLRARTNRRRQTTADEPVAVHYDAGALASASRPDVGARARVAIDQGRMVEALALLYAGALAAATDRGWLDVHPGDTEAECLSRARGRVPQETDDALRALVRAWQAAAYARRVPSRDQALALCDIYAHHFSGGPS